MHMTDALLSPAVGTAMCAVSITANAYAVKRIRREELCEKKIPLMGVAGAFVFAAQMINFAIPGTGSSGHIGGGVLLAALLGGYPALLTLSSVLMIQCLFFADGGLLALGCNIFNIGVIPCLVIYPLIFRPLMGSGRSRGRIVAAALLTAVVGLQLGALSVVLETRLSGIAELPFRTFLLFMQPIHLAIGLAEGIITAGILCFIHRVRPEIMESSFHRTAVGKPVSMGKVLAGMVIVTLLVGGGLSLAASSLPDGLEWSVGQVAGTDELNELSSDSPLHERAAAIGEAAALMPDYTFRAAGTGETGVGTSPETGTAAAGLIGSAFTFILAGVLACLIRVKKTRRNSKVREYRT